MKRWISFSSHLFAGVTSFVALSLAPVVAYGAVALGRSWQSGVFGDPSSVLVMPLLSALGAGVFSAAVAPVLSVAAQKCTRRFGWNGAMFPLLLACAGTVGFSLGNALLGWNWAPSLVIGAGATLGAAFSAYWLPLRWAQKVLQGWDAKYIALHERCKRQFKAIPTPSVPMAEKVRETWENFESSAEKKARPKRQDARVQL